MTHDELMQYIVSIDRTLCKLLLAVAEQNVPQSQDNALESIVGPVTVSQGLPYWKGRLIDAWSALEANPTREYTCAVRYAQKKVNECEVNAGIKGE